LQGGRRVVVLGGREGEVAGRESEIVLAWEGGGFRDGALEEGFRFSKFAEMDQGVGAVVDQGDVLRGGDDEGGIESGGFVVLVAESVEPGEEAGERGIAGVGGVELFDDGESLSGLALLFVEAGELGVQGEVVGIVGEGGGEEGLGLIGLFLGEEEMDEGGGCVLIFGVDGEEAAIGELGGGGIAGGFREFAGEEASGPLEVRRWRWRGRRRGRCGRGHGRLGL
jgi:hypothetical protein